MIYLPAREIEIPDPVKAAEDVWLDCEKAEPGNLREQLKLFRILTEEMRERMIIETDTVLQGRALQLVNAMTHVQQEKHEELMARN